MCLLIHKPSDKTIERVKLLSAFDQNGDGIGMAYVEDGELVIDKGYSDFEEFYEVYKLTEPNREMLIHFRAASPQMEISAEMCHPFDINDNQIPLEDGTNMYSFAVGHNGRLPWNPSKEGKSDTCMFTEEFLKPLLGQNPYFLDYRHGMMLLEKFVGDNNKLLILRFNRETKELKSYIINPKGGVGPRQARFVDGVWFSNDSYIPFVKHIHTPRHQWMEGGYSENWEGHVGYLPIGMHAANGGVGGVAAGKSQTNAQATQADKADSKSVQQAEDVGDEIARLIQSTEFGVDKDGWFWDFKLDIWRNKNTGHSIATLTSRPKLPRYMITRRLNEINGSLNKAKSESSSPPKVNITWPEVKAGAAFPEQKTLTAGGAKAETDDARFRREGAQMQTDLCILSDDEFEQKWGLTPHPTWRATARNSHAKKDVSVPRDTGVLEEDDDNTEEVLNRCFNKEERDVIIREASKFWVAEFGREKIKQVPKIERLKYMIQVLRNIYAPGSSTIGVLQYVLRNQPTSQALAD